VIDAIEARAWSFESIQQRRTIGGAPTWLHAGIAPARFWPVLGLLVDAYRSGALGVLVSYEEMGALFGKSRATWKRWRRELLGLGLMRQIGTCSNASEAGRARDNGRNLYQAGPELLAIAGEGVNEGTGGTKAQEEFRRRCAGQARARARRARAAVHFEEWKRQQAQRPAGLPESTPEPETQDGEARAVLLAIQAPKVPNPAPEIHRVILTPQTTPPPLRGRVVEGLAPSVPESQAVRPGLRPEFLSEAPPDDEPSGWTLAEFSAHLLRPKPAPRRANPAPREENPEGQPARQAPESIAEKERRRARADRIARELTPPDGDPWAAQKSKLWAVLGVNLDTTDDDDQGG
jgi:hypothetical protein